MDSVACQEAFRGVRDSDRQALCAAMASNETALQRLQAALENFGAAMAQRRQGIVAELVEAQQAAGSATGPSPGSIGPSPGSIGPSPGSVSGPSTSSAKDAAKMAALQAQLREHDATVKRLQRQLAAWRNVVPTINNLNQRIAGMSESVKGGASSSGGGGSTGVPAPPQPPAEEEEGEGMDIDGGAGNVGVTEAAGEAEGVVAGEAEGVVAGEAEGEMDVEAESEMDVEAEGETEGEAGGEVGGEVEDEEQVERFMEEFQRAIDFEDEEREEVPEEKYRKAYQIVKKHAYDDPRSLTRKQRNGIKNAAGLLQEDFRLNVGDNAGMALLNMSIGSPAIHKYVPTMLEQLAKKMNIDVPKAPGTGNVGVTEAKTNEPATPPLETQQPVTQRVNLEKIVKVLKLEQELNNKSWAEIRTVLEKAYPEWETIINADTNVEYTKREAFPKFDDDSYGLATLMKRLITYLRNVYMTNFVQIFREAVNVLYAYLRDKATDTDVKNALVVLTNPRVMMEGLGIDWRTTDNQERIVKGKLEDAVKTTPTKENVANLIKMIEQTRVKTTTKGEQVKVNPPMKYSSRYSTLKSKLKQPGQLSRRTSNVRFPENVGVEVREYPLTVEEEYFKRDPKRSYSNRPGMLGSRYLGDKTETVVVDGKRVTKKYKEPIGTRTGRPDVDVRKLVQLTPVKLKDVGKGTYRTRAPIKAVRGEGNKYTLVKTK